MDAFVWLFQQSEVSSSTEPSNSVTCKAAEVLGRREKVRVYEFLKEPLIRRFGEKWYNDLCEAAEAYLKEYGK